MHTRDMDRREEVYTRRDSENVMEGRIGHLDDSVPPRSAHAGLLGLPSSYDRQNPLPSHLVFSVVSMIFCLPFGIVALLQSLKVRQALRLNDQAIAQRASAMAAKYGLAAVMMGTHLAALVGTFIICYLYQYQ